MKPIVVSCELDFFGPIINKTDLDGRVTHFVRADGRKRNNLLFGTYSAWPVVGTAVARAQIYLPLDRFIKPDQKAGG